MKSSEEEVGELSFFKFHDDSSLCNIFNFKINTIYSLLLESFKQVSEKGRIKRCF